MKEKKGDVLFSQVSSLIKLQEDIDLGAKLTSRIDLRNQKQSLLGDSCFTAKGNYRTVRNHGRLLNK